MSKFHFVETQFHENKLKRMGIYKNVYNVELSIGKYRSKIGKIFYSEKNFFPNMDMKKNYYFLFSS